jgi:hypothetical protein
MDDYFVLNSHIEMSNQLCERIVELKPICNNLPILNETFINITTDTHELRSGKRRINTPCPIIETLFEWIRIDDNLVVRRLTIKWKIIPINDYREVIVTNDYSEKSDIIQFNKLASEFTAIGLTNMFNFFIDKSD